MIFVICGPTGSGKTEAAIKVASFYDCPIINADAFQIYKDMNIGTNKINQEDSNYIKHYLLDIKTPEETYSVKEYQDDFRKCINDLLLSNKNIVICGGTGLYIKASLYDYVFVDEEGVSNEFLDKTNQELFDMLSKLDKKAADKIHVNNRKRLVRAINLINNSNIKKSEIIDSQNHKLIYDNVEFLFINPDRNKLYEDINNRVGKMFEEGLVNEVQDLEKKYNLSQTARQAIGYKEVLDYLHNKLSLEDCKELIKKRTRNYAKRQVTFFKNQLNCKVFASNVELINEVCIDEKWTIFSYDWFN